MSYLINGWICVISGSIFIAIGGFLTTRGWSEFSNHSKRKLLISAAIRELEQNNEYLTDMDKYFKHISEFEKVYLLPTFHYNIIQEIRTSPFFSKNDSYLLTSASSYLYTVNPINNSVLKLNNIFSGATTSSSTLQRRKNVYKTFYNTPLLKRFRRHHEDLLKQLKRLKKLKKP